MNKDIKKNFANRVGTIIENITFSKAKLFKLDGNNNPYYTRDSEIFHWECKLRSSLKENKSIKKEIENYIKTLKQLNVDEQLYYLSYMTEHVYYTARATEEKIIFYLKINIT